MSTIWKYALLVDRDIQRVEMPAGAKILTVQMQCGVPCLWAVVNPASGMVARTLATYGTGHEVNAVNREYIGTYQTHSGALVFHVFEVIA